MIGPGTHLLLGSGSPRRRELLTSLGLPLVVVAVDVDEAGRPNEGAGEYLRRIVGAKLAAAKRLPEALGAGGVLVADTAVILDGEVLQKPRDEAEARSMIRALSGRDHEVCTRFALAAGGPPSGEETALHEETVSTRVRFRGLDEEEIAGYAATGEGLDKAGAYAIQGIGAFAVAGIEGSWSNVVGLPVTEVIAALRKTGLLERFPLPSLPSARS
ncbi:MAG TPA: Maf family protein [Polyangiaceae bacterium]|nr:Maf family protein [Polyangiaceae bacterium]